MPAVMMISVMGRAISPISAKKRVMLSRLPLVKKRSLSSESTIVMTISTNRRIDSWLT